VFILAEIRLQQTNPRVVGHHVESGKFTMPFSVVYLIEMDNIQPTQIGHGPNGFCLFWIAETGAAEGFGGGAER